MNNPDYIEGIKHEQKIFKYLNENGFCCKKLHDYHSMDFVCHKTKCFIEVKSRKYKKGTFENWIFGFDKVKWYRNKRKDWAYEDYLLIFINRFEDGDYFCCYNYLEENDYYISKFKRNRTYYNDKRKDYIFILDELFSKIEKFKICECGEILDFDYCDCLEDL